MLCMVKSLLQKRVTDATSSCAILYQKLHGRFETKEEFEAHSESMKKYNKAAFDYEYLSGLKKHQLVFKIVRLQRLIDGYTIVKGEKNIDGRDKIRVEHPDVENRIDQQCYSKRRVAFKIAYIGWNYMAHCSGSRNSTNITGHTNTVERVFLEALLRQQLVNGVGQATNLEHCVQTDSEVSATSQVVCVNVRSNLDDGYGVIKKRLENTQSGLAERSEAASSAENASMIEDHIPNHLRFSVDDRSRDYEEIPYIALLNNALPPDIRVLAWSPVSTNFSPRRACIGRTYQYFFPRGRLNIDLMNEAAQKLVGVHNFQNFTEISSENMHHSFEKELKNFKIEHLKSRTDPHFPDFDICSATITSSGFAYRQVRLMMAALIAVGNGSENPSIIDDLLNIEKIPSQPSYAALSGVPLVFHDASFSDDEISWRWDTDALKVAASIMGDIWTHNAMKCEVIRTVYGTTQKSQVLEQSSGFGE